MTRRESLDELAARAALRPHGNVLHVRPVHDRESKAEQAPARADGPGIDGGPGMGGSVSPPDAPAGPADPPEQAA